MSPTQDPTQELQKDPIQELQKEHIRDVLKDYNQAAFNIPGLEDLHYTVKAHNEIKLNEIGSFIDMNSLKTPDVQPLKGTGTGTQNNVADHDEEKYPIVMDILTKFFDYDQSDGVDFHFDKIDGKMVLQYLINFKYEGTDYTVVLIDSYGHAIYFMRSSDYKLGMSKAEMRQHGARRIFWVYAESPDDANKNSKETAPNNNATAQNNNATAQNNNTAAQNNNTAAQNNNATAQNSVTQGNPTTNTSINSSQDTSDQKNVPTEEKTKEERDKERFYSLRLRIRDVLKELAKERKDSTQDSESGKSTL